MATALSIQSVVAEKASVEGRAHWIAKILATPNGGKQIALTSSTDPYKIIYDRNCKVPPNSMLLGCIAGYWWSSKKKRVTPLPGDGETPMTNSSATSVTTKKAKTTGSSKAKEGQSVEKTKALLQRCSREVRTLRDKFELGAYDVNLSRIVTVVDSLWTDIQHSDIILLTTALFTLVETVEKVVNQPKRRDRLACLESVLGVVRNSSKLHLTVRRRAMVEEYANNCCQSLED